MANTPSGRNDVNTRITLLEADMRYILGEYGQPGKLKDVEAMIINQGKEIQRHVDRFNRICYIGFGVLVALQILAGNGLLNFAKIFGH
jgi:hypothetical protein